MGLSFQPQGPILDLSMTSLLGLEMEVGERKTPDFVGCWLLAKERRTNSGLKSKVFVDPRSQRSEDRGPRAGSSSGSVVISRTHSNLQGYHFSMLAFILGVLFPHGHSMATTTLDITFS